MTSLKKHGQYAGDNIYEYLRVESLTLEEARDVSSRDLALGA